MLQSTMPTGDLKNNIKKLQKELRLVKFEDEVNLEGLSQGKPTALLPVYQYVFTSYSHTLSELISSTVTELFGKTDVRFMEGVYKILRDLFNYKPSITKEQFFQNGFAERKIIMCTEILKLIQEKNKNLQPSKKAVTSATSTVGQIISGSKPGKPKSSNSEHAVSTGNTMGRLSLPETKPKSQTDLPPREFTLPTRDIPKQKLEQSDTSKRVSHQDLHSYPQVVNELLQPVRVDGPIARQIAPGLPSEYQRSSVTKPCSRVHRHISRHSEVENDNHHHQDYDSCSPPDSPPTKMIISPPRVYKEVLSADGDNVYQPRRYNCAVITPSIGRVNPDAVEIVSMPRGTLPFHLDNVDEGEEDDNTIQTVTATTPAHSILEPPSTGVLSEQTPCNETKENKQNGYSTHKDTRCDIRHTENIMVQGQIEALVERLQILETYHQHRQQQYDTMNARLTLLENRLAIIESKISKSESTNTSSVSDTGMHTSSVNPGTSTDLYTDKAPVNLRTTRETKSTAVSSNTTRQMLPNFVHVNPSTTSEIYSTSASVFPSATPINASTLQEPYLAAACNSDEMRGLQTKAVRNANQDDQEKVADQKNAKQVKQDYNTELADTPGTLLLSHQIDESLSLGLSPIRQIPGTPILHNTTNEDTFALADTNDPRRSSTPSQMADCPAVKDSRQTLGDSMSFQTDDTATKDLVNRIQNLFKSTETMLKGN